MSILAINGGKTAVTAPDLHFVWPKITPEVENAVMRQLHDTISVYDRSNIISALEDKMREYYSVKHALLTSSGAAALHTLYVGADLKEGDEVICPAYTFFATVTPLLFCGAVPVLVDCGESGNIDPGEIEAKISSRTRAIMVTHTWGIPCDMDAIRAVAARRGLLVFEYTSHTHGTEYKGQKVGSLGDASVFSL